MKTLSSGIQFTLGLLIIVGIGLPLRFFGWLSNTQRYQRSLLDHEDED